MDAIVAFIPEMITLVLAFGGCAVVLDDHSKEGTELKTTVASMDGKLDLVLHKLDMNGKH